MSKPKIKDIVVVALFKLTNPIGEAPGPGASHQKMTALSRIQMLKNLFYAISNLMEQAEIDHLKNSGKQGAVDHHYITRISTNEFFFYTREPLTLQEFEVLQNKVAEKVAKLPSGIHLVLGSFAVKTFNNRVMNVTAHITSGSSISFNFVIKSYTSSIDVRYKEENANGDLETLRTFDQADESGDVPKIDIAGTPRPFTFNNVISSKTPGGMPFLTVVDICLDHLNGVGRTNIAKLVNKKPTLVSQAISHMVVSNTIDLELRNCFGSVVHVDPKRSVKNDKKEAKQMTPHFFGRDEVRIFHLSPTPLQTVQKTQQMQEKEVKKAFLKEIERIEKLKFGPKDEPMNEFIAGCRQAFDEALTSEERQNILDKLQRLVDTLEDDEGTEQVREIIADFRKNVGPFSIGMHVKADRIEAAMSKVPLQDRCNFIQSESCKDVMRLLGEHRVRYKKGSSATLKNFKAKFFPEESREASRKEARENDSISPSPTPK